jgi:hypothetical protein
VELDELTQESLDAVLAQVQRHFHAITKDGAKAATVPVGQHFLVVRLCVNSLLASITGIAVIRFNDGVLANHMLHGSSKDKISGKG